VKESKKSFPALNLELDSAFPAAFHEIGSRRIAKKQNFSFMYQKNNGTENRCKDWEGSAYRLHASITRVLV
jgi:hypothetical protein